MKKRISVMLLAFMVMFSALPAFAFADTEEQVSDEPEVAVEATEAEADVEAVEEAGEEAEQAEAVDDAALVEEAAEETAGAALAEETVISRERAYDTKAVDETWAEEPEEPVIAPPADSDAEPLRLGFFKYTEKTSTYVILTWKIKQGRSVYEADDSDNFVVYTKEDGGKFKAQDVTIEFDPDTSAYTAKVEGLTPNTLYTFRVKEIVENIKVQKGIRTASALANVKGFKASSAYNKVMLKWRRVKGATGYTIRWKSGSRKGTIRIKRGSIVKYNHKLPASLKTKTITYSIVATRAGYGSSAKKATAKGEAVRTMYISLTFTTSRTLTSHDRGKKTTSFPAGTKVQAYGYNGGRYIFDYKGHTYFVKRYSVGGQSYAQLNTDKTYTKTEAENFVNGRGLKSNTNTLIWVNTFTQKLYLFKGSKGRWKLYKGPWDVCTGKAKTPTATGLTRVKSKSRGCHEPFPQTPWWCVCGQFSIHGKAPYYPAMGQPASNGCVRNWTPNAKWMYDNVPVGTAVFIF